MTQTQQVAEFDKMIHELFPGAYKCPGNAWSNSCLPNSTTSSYKQVSILGGVQTSRYFIIYKLQDGMLFYPFLDTGSATPRIHPSCDDAQFECGAIAVDVNGSKEPNIMGRDLMFFSINKLGQLQPIPFYKNGSSAWDCNPNSTTFYSYNGINCFTRIMRESWQMNY